MKLFNSNTTHRAPLELYSGFSTFATRQACRQIERTKNEQAQLAAVAAAAELCAPKQFPIRPSEQAAGNDDESTPFFPRGPAYTKVEWLSHLPILKSSLELGGHSYQLNERLHRSETTQVYKATDEQGRSYAVKVISMRTPHGNEREIYRDAKREIEHHWRCRDNPNTLFVHDTQWFTSRFGEIAVLVLEHVPKRIIDITSETQWDGKVDWRLPEKKILPLISQAARALQAAHAQGVVHGNVTPLNLLIDDAGKVKLADFGGSQKLAGPVAERPDGTLYYSAPEVLQRRAGDDSAEYSGKVDVYALGCTLYAMLIGKSPNEINASENPQEALTRLAHHSKLPDFRDLDLSYALVHLLTGMLQPDPAQRMTMEQVCQHPALPQL